AQPFSHSRVSVRRVPDAHATQFCLSKDAMFTTNRAICATGYQNNLFVASTKQGVAFKKMMCYVLSVK
ncbi:MAG: hypothetical protein ABJB40_13835, partial [Acidobacteriota bacterium]